MTEDLRPIDPEELLVHSGWMRALARGLVRDDATAEDLVQQAYAVALERPPRDRGALPAWLKTVVRNLAARSFRDQSRRAKREERVARPEGGDGPPLGELLERAELQRQVMEAVLELEEPFRTTVLLRYFEERSPQEVARRLGVPVATVGTRLHRALEKLRDRLDREQGGRAAWVALLAPWIGLTGLGVAGATAAAVAGAPSAHALGSASTASSTGSVGGGAGGGIASSAWLAASSVSSTLVNVLLGGVVIVQKPIIAGLVAGALCSAIGYGLGRQSGGVEVPPGKTLVDEVEYSSLVEETSTAKGRLEALEEERASFAAERTDLLERIAKIETALAEARESERVALAGSEPAFEGASTMTVSFGEWGELEELRTADWPELAGAVRTINELVLPLYESLESGGTVSVEAQRQIGAENNKLVKFGASIIEKIPSNAPVPVNGEFTHPVSLINMLAAMLDEAGLPLAASQRQELANVGAHYDIAFAEVDGSYDESTWEVTKILDEMSLKRDTMFDVEQILTPQQRAVVYVPEIQNRIRMDTLSPVNMVVMSVGVIPLEQTAELRATIVETWSDNLSMDTAVFEQNGDLVQRYEQDLAPILEPVSRSIVQFARLDDILIAGRAHERFFQDLVLRGAMTEEQERTIVENGQWAVPQVAPSGETAASDD